MDIIKFDSEFLTEYFKEKIQKEEFTIDDIRNISWIRIEGDKNAISQKDMDILMSIGNNIALVDVNLEGICISKASKSLDFFHCNLKNCRFEDCNIEKLRISSCEIDDNFIEQIGMLENLKELTISGSIKKDKEQILKDFPNYKELSSGERRDIWFNSKYDIYEQIDLSFLVKLKKLEKLDLRNLSINNDDLNSLEKLENLQKLDITDSKIDENSVLPFIKSLKELTVTNIEDLKILENCTNIEELSISCKDKDMKNKSIIKTFTELSKLSIANINDIIEFLPDSKELKDLSIMRCGIDDLNFLEKYENLEKVTLDGNNLTRANEEQIMQLSNRLHGNISFKKNPIEEELKNETIEIQDEETLKNVKRALGIYTYKDEQITKYDLITSDKDIKSNIEGKDALMTLFEKNIMPENIESITLDNLEDIPLEILEYISNSGEVKLKIDSFEGLDSEKLEILGKNEGW